jgi:hypothetical protein
MSSSKKNQKGHWTHYPANFNPEKAVGFIYLIVDLKTHEKYIGKKFFWGRGKKNKGTESNWKSYSSSSRELNDRLKDRPKSEFRFIIIEQYSTIGGLSFAETWSQITCETPSNNEEFMNRFIDKVTWKVVEPVTPQHKRRLAYWTKRYQFPKSK